VLEDLTRRVHVPMFASAYVFVVKALPDRGRWEPKARALARIVFVVTGV
jgi:hypothetical protein